MWSDLFLTSCVMCLETGRLFVVGFCFSVSKGCCHDVTYLVVVLPDLDFFGLMRNSVFWSNEQRAKNLGFELALSLICYLTLGKSL